MMGQTKEAEQMTTHIVTEEAECLECYRLLSAIYSKQENYNKVQMPWESTAAKHSVEGIKVSLTQSYKDAWK